MEEQVLGQAREAGGFNLCSHLRTYLLTSPPISPPPPLYPSLSLSRPYSFTSDSWAMGCILYEMATLKVRGRAEQGFK